MSRCLPPTITLLFTAVAITLLGGPGQHAPAGAASSEGAKVNKCGCYEESAGVCKCLRKSTCGCPGECEPMGCEDERQKDLARRMKEELKKIREDEREGDGAERERDGTESSKEPEQKQDVRKGR